EGRQGLIEELDVRQPTGRKRQAVIFLDRLEDLPLVGHAHWLYPGDAEYLHERALDHYTDAVGGERLDGDDLAGFQLDSLSDPLVGDRGLRVLDILLQAMAGQIIDGLEPEAVD